MKSITLGCILLLATFFTNPVTAQWSTTFGTTPPTVYLSNTSYRVAIGTTSASGYKLEVVRNDGYAIARFRNAVTSSTGDRTALIDIQNGSGTLWRYGVGGTNNGLGINAGQFYIERAGIGAVLTIPTNGNVGIGTNSPFRKLQVNGDIRLTSSGSRYLEFFIGGTASNQNDWRFDHTGSSLYLSSSSNDFSGFCDVARFGTCSDPYKLTVFGSALASGGTWVNSDLKLKRDVNDFSSAMDIIKQLRPKTYFFKSGEYLPLNLPGTKQYGFVAQDLEKVLPSLVQSSEQPVSIDAKGERKMEEIKSVNYTALIPVLTKAMQEQQQQIDKQQQQIEELKQIISSLQKGQSTLTTTNGGSSQMNASATDANLEQSTPNPSSNVASIRYYIPVNSKNAQLIVTDNLGNTIKQITLSSGKGVVNIDAAALSVGTYNYALWIGGRLIQSRKMIVGH